MGLWRWPKKIERSKIKSAERKGFSEGFEKGIENEKINLAIKMLDEKIAIDVIAGCTNLSITEIEKLKKELKNN